jgi:membrane protein implicated in regulation of membrane protease activity
VEVFNQLNHWHWWGMGALWIIGELVAPNGKFMAIGIAAAVTGLLLRLMPGVEVSWQLGVFAALTVTGLLVVNLRARKAAKT